MPGNALISVYDKTGLDRLAWIFSKLQIKMLGSGGTAETVRKIGLKVIDVSDYTGVKEMPGGLVKTLHPKIHAGILGDWSDPVQKEYLEANGIEPLDFVVVNLYPFQDVVRKEPENLRRAIDNIDIGGVALIRAAGKGALLNQRVVPLTSPSQYEEFVKEMERKGFVGNELRQRFAREAFVMTAEYDRAIRDYLTGRR
ncbi:MAG TPA: IMP cyclohydrolase [Candidatus Dormibacteraeota bacterium]|jgi:phosphoribosylaminoimidazolecarboxamide formyltransferase/IMP cyclohydrolase|nr:IMP cyclohydrolase [Candidatus Dormibacteraeota bacterium]